MFDHWHQVLLQSQQVLQQGFDLLDFIVRRSTASVIAVLGAWTLVRSALRSKGRATRNPKPPMEV